MIEIRFCEGTEELDACVQLEIETWGYDATEIVPRKSFLLAQKIGGQVIGAFDTESRKPSRRADRIRLVFAGDQKFFRTSHAVSAFPHAGREGRIP